jgi:two-component system response regulator MprA
VARILIVDDEADLVEVCTMALEAKGHSVAGITQPKLALVSAKREQPEVVVLDWVMPGCDGGAVLAMLRADCVTATTPVVLMSALPDGAARAHAAGADAFLPKPFDADQLAHIVAQVLRRPTP